MITPGLMVVKCLGDMPVIGKRIRIRYYNDLIKRLDNLNKQFSSTKIRFVTTMHELKVVIGEAHNIALEEDFRWFNTETIDVHSTTSKAINEALKTVLKGYPQQPSEGFRESGVDSKLVSNWYSNRSSFNGFIEDSYTLLLAYCDLNPVDAEIGEVYKGELIPEWNNTLKNFIGSRYFKFMVQDLLSALKLTLTSQIRMLNGEATETTKDSKAK